MPFLPFPVAVSTDRLLRAFALFLLIASSLSVRAWASPSWSLDYLHYDIMRAKSYRHRIYEVLVDTCEFIREDTALIPKRHLFINFPQSELDDTLIHPFDIHKIRFKVLSTLTADPFPTHIPLIAFDKRAHYGYEWMLDSQEYAGFVDRKNVLRILKKHGVFP